MLKPYPNCFMRCICTYRLPTIRLAVLEPEPVQVQVNIAYIFGRFFQLIQNDRDQTYVQANVRPRVCASMCTRENDMYIKYVTNIYFPTKCDGMSLI